MIGVKYMRFAQVLQKLADVVRLDSAEVILMRNALKPIGELGQVVAIPANRLFRFAVSLSGQYEPLDGTKN